MKDYREYVDMFVKGAKELAENVSNRTKKTASSVKIELDIKKAEQEMEKAYRALGRIMYQIENGTLKRDDQIVKAACDQIKAQEDQIAKLQKEKEDMKKPADENIVDVEATEVKEEEPEAEQPKPEKDSSGYFVLKFCPYCKVGNHPDATKCVSCGKDI